MLLILFMLYRLKGVLKLNDKIINLILDYTNRHSDCTGLPKANELFTPITKQLFSFKKLTLENWISAKNIEILKS